MKATDPSWKIKNCWLIRIT